MKPTDKPGFATHILAIAEIYGKALSPAAIGIYWTALQDYSLDQVQNAIVRHVNDPDAGRYLPKPADLLRHLPGAAADDGHPGPDEAWGLLRRFATDERETGVLTEPMREGWRACAPILDAGDEVGARKCFLEVYRRQVDAARQQGRAARWTVSLGADPGLREQRLREAVAAGRLGADQVRALLPGPAPAGLTEAVGLLDGPDARLGDRATSARLQALVARLRAGSPASALSRAEPCPPPRARQPERTPAPPGLPHSGQWPIPAPAEPSFTARSELDQ